MRIEQRSLSPEFKESLLFEIPPRIRGHPAAPRDSGSGNTCDPQSRRQKKLKDVIRHG